MAEGAKVTDKEKVRTLYPALKLDSNKLAEVYHKLERVLLQKTYKYTKNNETWEEIEKKAKGAVNFFFTQVNQNLFSPLKSYYAETKGVKGLKQFNEDFRVILDDLEDYLKDLKTIHLLDTKLLETDNEVEVSQAVAKIPSQVLTFQLFEDGKTPAEIAKERGLVVETIYGHLAKFAAQGILDLKRLFSVDRIKEFEEAFKNHSELTTLTEWKKVLPEEFTFHEIRLLLNHFEHLHSSKE